MFLTLCVNAQCWDTVSVGTAGYYMTAIKTNRTLWSWGNNGSGQLGDGTNINRNIPVQIGSAVWKCVSAGSVSHVAAIQSNGTLWTWGDNTFGQLGNGSFTGTNIPAQIGTDTDWLLVSAGQLFTVALKTNGTIWAWGRNNTGQLGDGTNINRNTPIQIGTGINWKYISAGDRHVLALKADGTLWAWGDNAYGMLGDGTLVAKNTPTQIGVSNDWLKIAAGLVHSLAIKTDGTLWSWGWNGYGQIGNGTVGITYTPIQIGSSNTWKSIAGGFNNSAGIMNNGTCWVWGSNGFGALGVGPTTGYALTPLQLGVLTNWKNISVGNYQMASVQTNGTLWAWGINYGTLGDSTTTDKDTPVQILSYNISVTANATSTNICSGTSVTLTAGGNAATYSWSGGVTNGLGFVPLSSTIYSVTGSDAVGCYNTATVMVTVNPTNTIIANATKTNVCIGSNVTLSGSGSVIYYWSGGVSDGVPFSPSSTATYSVTDGTACSNTATITVNVNTSPVFVSVNSFSLCAGTATLLTATATPSTGTTYSWSTTDTGSTLSVNPTTTTFYTVTATNTGCDASAITSVSVTPVVIPITGFSYASALCLTATNPLPTPLSGFSASGTYFSGAGLTINATTGLIDLGSSNAGTYIITYSVAANGCNPSSNSSFTISLNAPTVPVTNFSYASPFCQNDVNPSALLASNFVNGGTFNGTGLNVNATNGTIDLASSTAGNYTVSYQVNAANCVQAGTGTTTVVINSNPTLSTSSSTVIINGEQTLFTASSSANTYTWFPTTNLSCTNCANPTASPNVTTNYCVQTTDGVCTNSACINVIVESLCEGDKGLYLPNAFSPNGDGNNDVFCVQGETKCTTDFKMLIFDRWGEKVFETTNVLVCWDGTFNGKKLNPDVYVYYITAINKDQEKITKKGNVTLIK